MANRRNPNLGLNFATVFSAGTQIIKPIKPVNRFFVGDPDNIRRGWRLSPMRSEQIRGGWLDFPGDKHATRLPIPRLYRYAGVMGVSKTFNEQTLHNDPDSLPAVGLDFDGQMVMEVLKPGVEFVEDENNAYRLLVATRIGHDAIRARAFRVSADLRTLYSPGFVEYVKRDLISKIPDEIPIA